MKICTILSHRCRSRRIGIRELMYCGNDTTEADVCFYFTHIRQYSETKLVASSTNIVVRSFIQPQTKSSRATMKRNITVLISPPCANNNHNNINNNVIIINTQSTQPDTMSRRDKHTHMNDTSARKRETCDGPQQHRMHIEYGTKKNARHGFDTDTMCAMRSATASAKHDDLTMSRNASYCTAIWSSQLSR